MNRKIILIFITLSMLLSGCGNTDTSHAEGEKGSTSRTEASSSSPGPSGNFHKTADIYTLSVQAGANYESEVEEYDLGEREYTALSGKVMPYELRGVIGVPEGEGVFPLILITHGSHSNVDEDLRFDTGFTYLVKRLSENGYIAVSMDMSGAYLWKYGDNDDKEKSVHIADAQLQSLKAANEGSETGFPLELKGKIDFENMGLIGHSRGGDTVFDIALDQQSKGMTIDGILSIAPILPNDIEIREWPDAKISILVPEYDGDVASLDGFAIQSVLEDETEELHSVTFLRKANHNYFNDNLSMNDALLNRSEEQLTDQISKEAQQNFLADFASDFFRSVKISAAGTLYVHDTPIPNQMYGLDVMCRIGSGRDTDLADLFMQDSGRAEGVSVLLLKDSWFYKGDEVTADTITFGQGAYKNKRLLAVSWEQTGGSFTLTPEGNDLTPYDSLSIEAITDPASELNKGLDGQSFTVVLEDGSGSTSSVTLPEGLNSLSVTPGKLDQTVIDEKEFPFWSYPSPILSTRIPLSEFETVNLADIVAVRLLFDRSERGAIYLESLKLQ